MIDDSQIMHDIVKSQLLTQEKFLNLYSTLSRFFYILDESKHPLGEIPRIFIEETEFDTCLIILIKDGKIQEGFYSIYQDTNKIYLTDIERLNNNSLFPSLHNNVCGYQIIYIYPMVSNFNIEGFIVLGKKKDSIEDIPIKYIDLLCRCCHRLGIIHKRYDAMEKTSHFLQDSFSMINNLPYPFIVIENSGKVIWMNERAKKMLPRDIYPYSGIHIYELFPEMRLESSEKDSAVRGDLPFKKGDKKIIFEVDQYPIYNPEGKAIFKGIILKDITEFKLSEEENLFKEKMETLGMLSAGIAHDFNNMLTGILGYSSLLKNFIHNDERLLKYVEVIERSAERASSLTKQLLNFARKQERPSHKFDVRAVIEDSLILLCETLKNITVERNMEATHCIIEGDESEFQHIFLNLFMNAKEAMEGKGTIKVSTKNVTIGDLEYILISVEDTGKGMDDKVKEKLFAPYSTTKKSGRNMGLGLYRVERTVKKYNGFIEVESEIGKGTKFSIYIPINRDVLKEKKGTPQLATLDGEKLKQRKKVLVVDDEEFIGEMFSIVLNKMGIDVLYCNRGDEALHHLKNKLFDCIVLDIIMPGMKGDEVLKEIRKMGLSIPVIISSGYMSEDQREKVKSLGANLFLDKPFTEKNIISIMKEIIDD